MSNIAASIVLTLFAATLPQIFNQAKNEFSVGNYKQSLADFDLLDAESRKPGLEADRAKLAPVILFYRGATLAGRPRRVRGHLLERARSDAEHPAERAPQRVRAPRSIRRRELRHAEIDRPGQRARRRLHLPRRADVRQHRCRGSERRRSR